MLCGIDFYDESARYFIKILKNIVRPLKHFLLPFKWCAKTDRAKIKIMQRVLVGIAISIPVLYVLIVLLGSADAVFFHGMYEAINSIYSILDSVVLMKMIFGMVVGLYLFGLLYAAYEPKAGKTETSEKIGRGDVIILNIILTAMLTVYTIFIIIQFKYLFAGASLPYGLSYTDYARRGFFELLFLSGVNIFTILLMCHLTKRRQGLGAKIIKYLCLYLCAATVILLASSFYRMSLYSVSDGLTRLRFMVYGFLIFECLGLFLTFYWILKPKFNIIIAYLSIALIYYMLLNLVPMDYFIAKDQVDRYLSGRRTDVRYALTLSSDAAPQIKRLLGTEADYEARWYFFWRLNDNIDRNTDWRGYNISVSRSAKP
jgi:hypothetical protein